MKNGDIFPCYPVAGRSGILTTMLVTLACFGCLLRAEAVTPAPDGGYPGGNTAEGQNALFSLTTGGYNTANGWVSLHAVSSGSFNTAIGAATLFSNTADQNTATGTAALFSNTVGAQNTATGAFALISNATGGLNTATGASALFSNTTGFANSATGNQALYSNSTGNENTANGSQALFLNTTGNENTAIGTLALEQNTIGNDNTAAGYEALNFNTTGNNNTASGSNALLNNTEGHDNTANGNRALYFNTTGNQNTAIGVSALGANTTGINNTAIGYHALQSNTGNGNTALGVEALSSNTSGASNIAVGPGAGSNVTTAVNVICIGAEGNNVDNSCYIGNIFGATSSGGVAVFVNSNGRLGTATSSKRFKEQIKPMDSASKELLALHPVTFRYKKEIDPRGTAQFGLVAEEVEKVNPDLVVRDKDGKPYSVRYDQVNAMLLNEFLKEHRKNEAQEASIAELKKEVQALTAGLQKISAQVELKEPITKTVVNNQR